MFYSKCFSFVADVHRTSDFPMSSLWIGGMLDLRSDRKSVPKLSFFFFFFFIYLWGETVITVYPIPTKQLFESKLS
jgi:hypothetical protein